MKDYLNDLINHTQQLGIIETIKVVGTDQQTAIKANAQDRTVMISGKFKQPHAEFNGTFGMPNLPKLKTILGFEEYDEHATLTITRQDRDGVDTPVAVHFETQTGDFINDYRLMSQAIVEETVKEVKFAGAAWNVEFEPRVASIQRLAKQMGANSEHLTFKTKMDGSDLKIYFGDVSSHSANFVFEGGLTGTMQRSWAWPAKQFLSIMLLQGDKKIFISDQGAMKITVDSGIADYEYLLPAQQA